LNNKNAAAYYQRGRVFTRKHQIRRAFQEFSKALILDSRNLKILDHRAALSLMVGDYNLAIKDYTCILGSTPIKERQRSTFINRAMAYVQLNRFQDALDDYRTAGKISASDHSTSLGVAYCLEHLGRHKEALAEYSQIIKQEPNNLEAYLERGWCYQKIKDY